MVKNIVQQIFYEKISDIESRIPVKLNISYDKISFNEVLNQELMSYEEENINYDQLINAAAKKYNLPDALIKSVIKTESDFNPKAQSHAGAQGLMQLMPETAHFLGLSNPWNPKENIEGGTKYLRQLIDQYGGDIVRALAAYNAGPSNVQKYNGIPPFKETQQYVQKVLSTYNQYRKAK